MLFCYCGKDQTADQVPRNIARQLLHLSPAEKAKVAEASRPLAGKESCTLIDSLIQKYESVTLVIDSLDKCHLDDSNVMACSRTTFLIRS